MKIFKRIVVILIGLISVLSINAFASTGKINVSATRLRKENNTTSDILTKIYEDEEVEIVEEFGEWVKVKYKKYTGYIKKEFVDIKEDKEESGATKQQDNKENVSNYEDKPQENQNTNEVTLLQNTSLRLIPNFMSNKIQEIAKETKLTIVTQMNQWVKVTDGVVTGWVLKSKTDLGSNATTPQVNPSDIDTTINTNTTNNKNENNTVSNKTNTVERNKNTVTNNTVENNVSTNNITDSSTITSVSKKGKVNVETANVRKEPSTSSKRIEFLDEGDIVTITEETDKWYKIKHGNIEGYVSKDLITITSENNSVSSRSLTEERQQENSDEEIISKKENEKVETTNVSGNSVVDYAKQYLNYPYVVAGKTPETGFDCSGFTRYIYKNFGYELSSVSSGQTSVGTEVSRENLKPGDLILFYNEEKTKIGHTGIYIGNGEFIHAANAKRGVVIDNINTLSYYNERFVTARRIVE